MLSWGSESPPLQRGVTPKESGGVGFCGSPDSIPLAAAAGCDYLELGFSAIARMSEAEFAQTLRLLEEHNLRCEALNSFIPGEFSLCSLGDDRALKEYLRQGFTRMKALGAGIVVFGSSGARKLPEGWPKPEGWRRLAPVLRMAGTLAARYGVTIAIEPLREAECNCVNTLREGLALMERTGHPRVRLLADMFHMGENGEDFDDILLAGGKLVHCHIGRPGARTWPMPGDGYDYAPFFSALREIGYDGRVSVEAGGAGLDLGESVGFLRGLSSP